MPYIGRALVSGNYQKLDSISSSFNGTTTTFNLTSGGSAFYPGSAFSILVSLGGVIQEPISAYTINLNQITFATAPTAGTAFFCIVLGTALGIGVPGDGTVSGAKLSSPFNYNSGLLYLDSVNNRVGVASTTPTATLSVLGSFNVSGGVTASALNVSGLSTFTNGPVLIGSGTSTGTATQRLQVTGGAYVSGSVGIGITNPQYILHANGSGTQYLCVSSTTAGYGATSLLGSTSQGSFLINQSTTLPTQIWTNGNPRITIDSSGNVLIGTANSTGTASQPLQVTGGAYVSGNTGIGITNPQALLHLGTNSPEIRINNSSGGNFARIRVLTESTANAADLAFSVGAGEALRIINSGSVGIATTNPNQLLQVGAASTQAFFVTSTGDIGIGIQSPGSKLDIANLGTSTTVSTRLLASDSGGNSVRLVTTQNADGSVTFNANAGGNGSRRDIIYQQAGSEVARLDTNGRLGIGTTNPSYTLQVNGSFAATTKSFVIPHPTKENYKLRYASLEGEENGVYIRGRATQGIIELPEYWTNLVDENSITVHLTPIGNKTVWVEEINNNKVYINSDDTIDCFYTVFAERKDVEKLVVEVEGN